MKTLSTFILLLFGISLFSQQLKIDRITHEFGVIPTWEGLHRTKFTVVNESSSTQVYKELHSSCGCAVASVSKDTLQMGDTTFLFVILDPANESGKFKKSLSIQFNNDQGEITNFYINLNGFGLTQEQLKSLQSSQKQKEANVKFFYQQREDIEDFDTESDLYKNFIAQSKKEVLFNQHVKVLINLYAKSSDYAYDKVLKSIRKNIIRDLRHENISEDKIIFANPSAELSSDTNYIQLSIIENKREEKEFASINYTGNSAKNSDNYPMFLQIFKGGTNHLDTNSVEFQNYMSDFSDVTTTGDKLNILLFSSSSKAPNNVGYTSYQMSLLRGRRVKESFIREALRNDIDTSLLNIKVIPLVGGPEFSTRYYLVDFYYNFQYVKIIATKEEYEEGSFLASDGFIQYFYSGQNDINTTSKSFQKLIQNISTEIDKKGYATILLEASASKIPTAEYRTCEVLSYARINAFKKALTTLLYQEGIDFRKVIYTDERALVQGPDYDKEKEESVYTPFQYIKAFVH